MQDALEILNYNRVDSRFSSIRHVQPHEESISMSVIEATRLTVYFKISSYAM